MSAVFPYSTSARVSPPLPLSLSTGGSLLPAPGGEVEFSLTGVIQFSRLNAAHSPFATSPTITQPSRSISSLSTVRPLVSQTEESTDGSQDHGNVTQGAGHE